MKKILSKLLLASFFALSVSATAMAEKTPAEILPHDIQFYFELEADQLGVPLQTFLEDLIDSEVTTGAMEESDAEIAEPYYTLLREKLKTQQLVLGIKEAPAETDTTSSASSSFNYTDPVMFGFIPMTAEEYQNKVVNVLFNWETAYEEALIENQTQYEDTNYANNVAGLRVYYNSIDDFFHTHTEGFMIISDYGEDFAELGDETIEKLQSNEDFAQIESALAENNFFKFIFKDIEELMAEFPGFNDYAAIISEGLTVNTTEDGFELELFAITEESGQSTNDITLHNRMSSESDVIFFSDAVSQTQVKTLLTEDLVFQEIQNEILAETNVDITPFVDALSNEMALLIEDTGKMFPKIELLALLTNAEEFKTELDSIITSIWEEAEKEATSTKDNELNFDDEDYKVTATHEVENGLHNFNFTIESKEKENPYATKLPEAFTEWSFSIGVRDNVFVFTNDKYEEDEAGINNAEIQAMLATDSNSLMYFDMQALKSYLQSMITMVSELDEANTEDFKDLDTIKTNLDTFFEPWGQITSTGNVSTSTIEAVINIDLDLDKLIALIDGSTTFLALETLEKTDNVIDQFADPADDFADVKKEDWFADDVYYLNSVEIVDGYADETFKPIQEITRAEFLKFVLEGMAQKDQIMVYDGAFSNFNDVDFSHWAMRYIDTAYREKIVSGYPDNTFAPDQKISRAEAASIINNIIEMYGLESDAVSTDAALKFKDITAKDWFVEEVSEVYRFGLMTGLNENYFGPNQNLNRAETAKIVRNLMELF